MCRILSYMQWKQGRNRFVVTDVEHHVIPVRMLSHFCCTTQPWGETSLQCCIVGRNWGTSATEAPENAICPSRFSLLSTDRNENKRDRRKKWYKPFTEHYITFYRKIKSITVCFWWREVNKPGVVCMSAHIKLICRWEIEWSFHEAFKDRLCVFSHVELQSKQIQNRDDWIVSIQHDRRRSLFIQYPLLVVVQETGGVKLSKIICLCEGVTLMMPHLIPLPQKRQLVAVNGTFHHMDVVVFNTEV